MWLCGYIVSASVFFFGLITVSWGHQYEDHNWRPNVAHAYGGMDFDAEHLYGGRNVRKRFLDLMRVHNEECLRRVEDINDMKFMYEESPHYEMGYIMGEIIERYRKMVATLNHVYNYINVDVTLEHIHRTESMQKLYLEIDHLVRMMHEIPRKWEDQVEFKNIYTDAMDFDEVMYKQKLQEVEQRKTAREMQKYWKRINDMTSLYEKYKEMTGKAITPPPNRFWTHNYGWEIQYDWFNHWYKNKNQGK